MRTLELGKHRRARVWTGDRPDATYPPVRSLSRAFAADGKTKNVLGLGAVEVFVPLGPRAMYGLLGGNWHPNTTGRFTIEVGISAANERLLADSLAMKGDEVRVGLPAEFAEAVLAGADLARAELNTLASGKLAIDCAAHCAVGSCEAVYRCLAVILVKMFNAAEIDQSDEELVKLFPATFR